MGKRGQTGETGMANSISIGDIRRMVEVMDGLGVNTSVAMARRDLAVRTGEQYGGNRDLYKALGYPTELSYMDYLGAYNRGGVAEAIINAYPDATWKAFPSIRRAGELLETEEEEGELEREWKKLAKRLKLWAYLKRADILAGIGQYSVIYLGVKDGRALDTHVGKGKVGYISVYSEENAQVGDLEEDVASPRFGLPKFYLLKTSRTSTGKKVHWSRCIHVSEGLLEDDIYGTPRLRSVYNRLMDLEKLNGGSAEMFWRGAFPGYGFKADSDAELSPTDETNMTDEIEEFVHSLKRYLRIQGVEVQEFRPQVASPKDHVEVQYMEIAGAKRIPMRILVGSERGELASTTDESNWLERIAERRLLYAEPFILNELIDRLTLIGELPMEDDYEVVWPDLESTNEKAKAEIAQRLTKALTDYARTPGAEIVLPPELFLKIILHMSAKEIAMVKKWAGYLNWTDELEKVQQDSMQKGMASEPVRDFDSTERESQGREITSPSNELDTPKA